MVDEGQQQQGEEHIDLEANTDSGSGSSSEDSQDDADDDIYNNII